MENEVQSQMKVLKRQPGLGTLNRLTRAAQDAVIKHGHKKSRFKRDYANGNAVYGCSVCGATARVEVSKGDRGAHSMVGNALTLSCIELWEV